MIRKRTVLVLGAGASAPYEFPTAAGLVKAVHESATAPLTSLRITLGKCGFDSDEVLAFCRALKDSGQYSIDAFLERQPRFLKIGKAAIAAQLLPREHMLPFSSNSQHDEDWYRYLFANMMPRVPGAFLSNRLKVITFNFDRSFEWRLRKVLTATYELTSERIEELARTVEILHVHGRLGDGQLPVYPPDGSSPPTPPAESEILACSNMIRIGWEAEGSGAFSAAQDWLRESEVVCFIGFSYNEDSLNRLGGQQVLGAKTLYGTCLHMSTAEVWRVYNYFNMSARHDYLIAKSARGFFDVVDLFGTR